MASEKPYYPHKKMEVTVKEMDDARVPTHRRDYCAHVYIPLMKCRKENYYLPWRCQHERHAWHECEYEDFMARVKEKERLKKLAGLKN